MSVGVSGYGLQLGGAKPTGAQILVRLHTGALLYPQRAAALTLWKTRFLATGTVGTCGA